MGLSQRLAAAFTVLRSGPPALIGPGAPPVVSTGTHPFLRGENEFGCGRGLPLPFLQNPWVMRAIKHVADPIAGRPLKFLALGKGGKYVPYNDPDLESYWQRPAVGPEGPIALSNVLRATVIRKKLDGHCFWVFGDDWLPGVGGSARNRSQFIIIPAAQMRPVWDSPAKAKVKGWWFRDASGKDWPLLPEQVLHPSYCNPYDPVSGASEYSAVRVAAEADTFAAQFVRSLMQGNGDRGPIVSPKDPGQVFTLEQEAQITLALETKRRANLEGTFKPAFFGAAVEVSEPQIASPNAEFAAQRSLNKAEIFAGFGVPPSMAEAKAKYSTGAESDRRVLIEDTCMPEAEDIAAVIALAAMWQLGMSGTGGDHLCAVFDWSGHSVIQDVTEQKIKGPVKELHGMGVPMDVLNERFTLGLPSFVGSDKGFIPFNLQTVDDALAAKPGEENVPDKVKEGDKAALPDKEDGATKLVRLFSAPVPSALERALQGRIVDVDTTPPAPDPLALPPARTAATPSEDGTTETLWRKAMSRRVPMERATASAVSRLLQSPRRRTLSNILGTAKARAPGDGDPEGAPDGRQPDDLVFDLHEFTTELTAGLDKISTVHMQQAADFTRSDFGVDDPWTMTPQSVTHALASRKNLLADCAEGVFDDVRKALQDGFDAGDTTAELADRVREAFKGISKERAQVIATTETGAAYGAGSAAGAASAGAKSKMWLSARDSRVRHDHKEADGQTVAIDGYFSVGGELCQYPCADGLSAAQACNCRCDVAYRVAPVEGSA